MVCCCPHNKEKFLFVISIMVTRYQNSDGSYDYFHRLYMANSCVIRLISDISVRTELGSISLEIPCPPAHLNINAIVKVPDNVTDFEIFLDSPFLEVETEGANWEYSLPVIKTFLSHFNSYEVINNFIQEHRNA